MLGVGQDLLRRAFFDDAAVVEKQDASRHLGSESHLVSDDDHGHAFARQQRIVDTVDDAVRELVSRHSGGTLVLDGAPLVLPVAR